MSVGVELCDAVEGDCYAIGSVPVSNFLMPDYSTRTSHLARTSTTWAS